MDKVKIVLAVLKKYHFWALCGLIVLIALGSWVTATAELAAQYDSRKQQLDASFRSVESISSVSPHPNEKVIDAIDSDTDQLKQDVFGAWQTLYQEQARKNQLADALTDEFKMDFYQGGEISRQHLTLYQTFILDRFVTLFNDVLNVYRPVDEDGSRVPVPSVYQPDIDDDEDGLEDMVPGTRLRMGGMTNQPGGTTEMTGIVNWDGRYALRDSFDWPNRPTTEQVRTAQEDLWVYEALLRVIRDTNLDPTATEPIGRHNAAVIEIITLKIGSDLFGAFGEESDGTAMVRSRYVDQNAQPLADGAAGPAEYNIMPILLVVSIDQSKIPKLLAECGNSNMPIEVRNVRIRPGQGEGLDLGAIAPANSFVNTETGPGADLRTGTTYIPVEIQGLVYIYNPPDAAKLGTGAPAESPDATPEAATQAATDTTPEPSPEPGPTSGGPASTAPEPAEAPVVDPTQE